MAVSPNMSRLTGSLQRFLLAFLTHVGAGKWYNTARKQRDPNNR